jgi:thiamine biosynthesis lipoprotein
VKGISFPLVFLSALCALALSACTRPSQPQRELALGTVCVVNLYEKGDSGLYSRIFFRIREIDRTMSAFESEFQDMLIGNAIVYPESPEAATIQSATEALVSGVAAVNRQAGIEPVKVRADLLDLLEKALHYAELSGGAFDPTIGPLVKLWGIGTENQRIPDYDEIADALDLVDWRDLIIDRGAGTAFLAREGMALDLGAIAKGYAADEAARIADEGGVKHAVIDLGGNISALGWRGWNGKNFMPWRIGVQNPLKERGAYIGVLQVHDASIVTSGVYERYFESGGIRYHHILSTDNGYPVNNGLLSVTIVAKNSTEADALSTTVFALGFEKGKALIDSIVGAEAIFIFSDKRVHITGGLQNIFTLVDDEFTVF